MTSYKKFSIFIYLIGFFLLVAIIGFLLYENHELLRSMLTSDWVREVLSGFLGEIGLIGLAIAFVVPFLGSKSVDPKLRKLFGAKGCLHNLTIGACWLLRVPTTKVLSEMSNNLLCRDRSVATLAYVDRIVDRIINKGRGMLTFNSGLIAFSAALIKLSSDGSSTYKIGNQISTATNAAVATPSHMVVALQSVVLVNLCISSILMLEVFVVRWAPSELYKTVDEECFSALVLCRDRSIIMNFAIFLSAACVIGLLDEVIP